ncbi:hypothetical protein [Trinickia mobilis]|nr:hypothetical protein [Trinickia mobilis]
MSTADFLMVNIINTMMSMMINVIYRVNQKIGVAMAPGRKQVARNRVR